MHTHMQTHTIVLHSFTHRMDTPTPHAQVEHLHATIERNEIRHATDVIRMVSHGITGVDQWMNWRVGSRVGVLLSE